MNIFDRIREAIDRRLETDDDRALKDEQWEADMRADGWTKVPDRDAGVEVTTAGPVMTAAEVDEDMRRRIASAEGREYEDQVDAYNVELPGGQTYTTHDPDWAQAWRDQDQAEL